MKGGKLQKPALSHVWYCFPWRPSRDESGRFPISPEHKGSSARAGDSSELHRYQIFILHLQESVWTEMRGKLSVELRIWECPAELLQSRILWPQGQSIEDLIAEAHRVLGNTDNCGEFVPEN